VKTLGLLFILAALWLIYLAARGRIPAVMELVQSYAA
jgi:hypothetical protein